MEAEIAGASQRLNQQILGSLLLSISAGGGGAPQLQPSPPSSTCPSPPLPRRASHELPLEPCSRLNCPLVVSS